MALWAKIQTLNSECQRQILSLYDEDHKDYRFPIELRNLFAEVIEDAVCGGNINNLDSGLDPYNTQHRDQIIQFFTSLINQLEDRHGNAQSGDQFFTKHKLSEALLNFQDKKQSDPLGLFEHIRNRIKVEISLVVQQEAAVNSNMAQEKDAIMENIQFIKSQIAGTAKILKEIQTNEENFELHCTRKQEIEGILSNPEKLNGLAQQCPNYEIRIRDNLSTLEGLLQQNIRTLQVYMERFEQAVANNLNNVAVLQGQIVNEKLAIWKHEQQQMANGINKVHAISLDKIQIWCEELAELIWHNYGQLKEAERMLITGTVQTGNASNLNFVQSRTEEVVKLLEELLNHSLIVEEQPPQIIKMKTKFPKPVVATLLVGKRLNIHMDRPTLSTRIISEDQAKNLPVADQVETIGEITNGQLTMECKDDSKRLTATFRSMQLKTIKRTDRRGTVSSERVMEEKSCLYFSCLATVGPLKFKVATISLPVVVISHGSQEALAVASISWDNAFGEIGRVPFKVKSVAAWADVAQILDAKFVEVTGRGLTEANISCLAQKAFKNRRPQETISWAELCKDNLPGRNFTFWAWYHAALKLIEKKETHLKELWKEGLIMGFIQREIAEGLISRCEPGTFLLRFADSINGAITIALLVKPGTVLSLNPFQMLDLQNHKLAMSIKELDKVKFLYQENRSIPKDDAFGKFYEKEQSTPSNGSTNPYVPIKQSIPDEDANNGSATPVPMYDGSGRDRWSQGSLPGLSPIHIDQPHSPFFPHSPNSFHDMQPSSTMMGMEYLETPESSHSNGSPFLFVPATTNGPVSPISNTTVTGELETPRATSGDGELFQYPTSETFSDLIKIISRDEPMDMQT